MRESSGIGKPTIGDRFSKIQGARAKLITKPRLGKTLRVLNRPRQANRRNNQRR
jgi:hypothetical protein